LKLCLGTWSKKSKVIAGRKPLKQDIAFLNYGHDSEAEWEEDEEGEECRSDEEDEEESIPNGDDGDDEVWKYLSAYIFRFVLLKRKDYD